jgi:hypothetical protein
MPFSRQDAEQTEGFSSWEESHWLGKGMLGFKTSGVHSSCCLHPPSSADQVNKKTLKNAPMLLICLKNFYF